MLFWSYQLNSTANLANLAQFWGKWAGLAVLFSWQLQNGPHDLDFFSIAMSADYSIELISIQAYAPQFNGHNKIFLGSVFYVVQDKAVYLGRIFPKK